MLDSQSRVGSRVGIVKVVWRMGENHLGVQKGISAVKYVNYIMLLVAIVLAFAGLYYWLAKWQIDYAALFFAFAAGMHAVYLHSTKANKAG